MGLTILNRTRRPTPRQLQILKAVAAFQQTQCCSPTLAELAAELGTSRSTVFEHIAELRRKKLLSTSPGRARSLNLTSTALKLLDHADSTCDDTHDGPVHGIALAGRVAAGTPITAIQQNDSLSLASHFGSQADLFALEVVGDSMSDADIRDGDYVICRPAATAANGQLVVAILDEENATLKRFYKEPARVRLEPANDDYQPIFSDNCRIEAAVVGLIRRF